MCASPPDGLARLCGEAKGDRIFQSPGPAYDRTEARRPEEIIADTMPAGRTRFAGEVVLRIEKVARCRARRVIDIERARGEELVQVPGAAHRHRCRLGSHQSPKLCRRNGVEYPLQDKQIEVLMTKRKNELGCEAVTGPVALVEDSPSALLAAAAADVLFGHADGMPHRGGDAKCLNKG